MEKLSNSSMPMSRWGMDEQPAYKIRMKGLTSLSNAELLSLLINSGTKDKSALHVAQDLLQLVDNNLSEFGKLSLAELTRIKGLGQSKACLIVAAIELGRRRHTTLPAERECITNSNDIAQCLRVKLKDFSHEVFAVIFLNRANRIKHFEIVSSGGITGTVADPRLILKKAIEQEATSLILAHNHPSGNLKPSHADEEITSKIKLAASYLDIKVLDHIIVSEEGYYSFADEGKI